MKSLLRLFPKFSFSFSDSKIAKTVRPNSFRAWLLKSRRGDNGYLRILAMLRIFAYLGAVVTLYLPTFELTKPNSETLWVAIASIVYSSIFLVLGFWNWPLFVSGSSKRVQVVVDLVFISSLWALSNRPYSNLFLLYLIPIFVSVEFLSPLYAVIALCTAWISSIVAFEYFPKNLTAEEFTTLPSVLGSRLAILSSFTIAYLSYLRYQTSSQDDPERLRVQIIDKIKRSSMRPTDRHKLKVLIDQYVTETERRARLRGYLADQNLSSVMDAAFAAFERKSQAEVIHEIMRLIAHALECDAGTFRLVGKDIDGNDSLVLTQAFGELEPASNEIRYLKMRDEWFVVQALKRNKTEICLDIGSSKRRVVQYSSILCERYHLRSAISTPITIRNVKGVVTMYRNRVRAFTKDEQVLFEVLAPYLALVFISEEKRQTETLSKSRKERLNLLQSLSELAHFDKEEEILQLVVDKILKDLNAEGSAVFLIRGNKLKRKAVSGIGTSVSHENDWFYPHEGINGHVFLSGEFIVRNDAMTNRAFLKPESFETYCNLSRFKRIEHIFVVPLIGKFGTFGVLRVSNKLTPGGYLSESGFSDEDVEVMLTVASVASIALDRLQQANRSELLFKISNFIGITRDRRSALNYIVDQARHLINVNECGIALFDDEGKVGHVIADTRDHAIEELRLLLSLEENESIAELRRTREPLGIVDAQNDPRMKQVAVEMRERGIKSILLIPILIDGKIVGTLGFDSVEEEREFTQHEKELCKIVASLCAAALAQSEFIEQISDEAISRERQRLYGSLHDTKGMIHAGVMLPLDLTNYRLQNNEGANATEQISQIWRCSRFIYDQLNWIMQDSADPVLASEGLRAAIERFCYMLAPKQIILDCDPFDDLDFQDSVSVYRIAQEAVANAVKHNKSHDNYCLVRVSLKEFTDHGELVIEDDGCGFNYEEKRITSFGIRHMEEMTLRIKGSITFESVPNRARGTCVKVCWPLRQFRSEKQGEINSDSR